MASSFFIDVLLAVCAILGAIGFFRANAAHAELRALRRLMEERENPAPPIPAAVPETIPATVDIAPVEDPPAPADPPPEIPTSPARETPKLDLETLLTAKWGVWLGSAALLLSGVFLIRHAVDQGLLGPGTRCALAGLLGLALLAGAEWLYRRPAPISEGRLGADQAPAGLAAGGTAILFGAAYGAGPFYDLLPPLAAFTAMALASFIAMGASLRYGPLTAATGIAGAFVSPALVAAGPPSWPGLFAYLFVVSAAALWVVRHTAWTWLAWATTIAGALWIWQAAFMGGADSWAAAVFVPAAAALNLLFLPPAALDHPIGRQLAWLPFAVLGCAGLTLEALAPGMAPRLALFALSPLAIWRGATEARLDRMPWIAAAFGLAALAVWDLPAWAPTGDTVALESGLHTVFMGAWAPASLWPLLSAAAVFAGFHAVAGLWFERRTPRPLHWSALPAAIPVLVLTIAYTRIAGFQTALAWAAAALALAAGLTAASARAAAENARQRAGIHAAGATAALALGFAMLLRDQWLTLAVAAFLPALAWIEARADLPALRQVAMAVGAVVLLRAMGNWYILDYALGHLPLANGLIASHALPAASFAATAAMFRRRADDRAVALLEVGAAALAAIFVALELRHGFGTGRMTELFGFNEVAWHVATLSAQAVAYLLLARRTGRPMLAAASKVLGATASLGALCLLIFNPFVTGAHSPILALAAGYLAPAGLALFARTRLDNPPWRRALALYAPAAGFVWIALQVHQLFHPTRMGFLWRAPEIADAELWAWSGAWLAYGIGLMALGIRTANRGPRLAALGVVAIVCAKVFLIDMSGLTGLWRVLSFLGLGLALIGLGAIHRRFVAPTRQPPEEAN